MMHGRSFRFLDSPDSLRELRLALEQVGLTEQEAVRQGADDEEPAKVNPYRPACLRFVCPWLSQPVDLHWAFSWCADGTDFELEAVSVTFEGVVRGGVDVAALRGQKLLQPLAEVVIEGVATVCATVTGKRKRPPRRRQQAENTAEQSAAADRPRE